MSGPEARVERDAVRWAKGEGWAVFKLSFPGMRGAPDRVFIRRGRVVLGEFKAVRGRASALQDEVHDRLRAAGAEVHEFRSVEEVKRALA